MKKGLTYILVFLLGTALITSCAPTTKKFVHDSPAFSYEYPGKYIPDELGNKDEVSRFVKPTQYKLPVYTASVRTIPKGVKLEDLPDILIQGTKKNYPNASRFKILEKKRVTLSDGSEAMTMKYKWKYSPAAMLQSSSVMAIKDDKLISITGSTLFGYTPLEEMMKHCLTLDLNP